MNTSLLILFTLMTMGASGFAMEKPPHKRPAEEFENVSPMNHPGTSMSPPVNTPAQKSLTGEEFENLSPNERLFHGVSITNIEHIRYAIQSGANINVLDSQGLTPLHHAILSFHNKLLNRKINDHVENILKIIEYLLINGAQTTLKAYVSNLSSPVDAFELTTCLFFEQGQRLLSLYKEGSDLSPLGDQIITITVRLRELFQLLLSYHPTVFLLREVSAISGKKTFSMESIRFALDEIRIFRSSYSYIQTTDCSLDPRITHLSTIEAINAAILSEQEDSALSLVKSIGPNAVDSIPTNPSSPFITHNEYSNYVKNTLCFAARYGCSKLITPLVRCGANPIPVLRVMLRVLERPEDKDNRLHHLIIELLKQELINTDVSLIKEFFLQAVETDDLALYTSLVPFMGSWQSSLKETYENRLEYAAQLNARKITNYILTQDPQASALISQRDPCIGGTALHRAAQLGNSHTVEELINYGADVKARNDENKTPLQKVEFKSPGSIATLRTLLEHGANPYDITITETLPARIFILLLQFGESAGIWDHFPGFEKLAFSKKILKDEPLMWTIVSNDLVTLKLLLSEKITSKQLDDLVLLAAGQGNQHIVQFLLDREISLQTVLRAISNVHVILSRLVSDQRADSYHATLRVLEAKIVSHLNTTTPLLYFSLLPRELTAFILRLLYGYTPNRVTGTTGATEI